MNKISTTNTRLGDIQKTLKAPKSQHNSFGNYNYRNCEDILEAVKSLLKDGESVVLNDEIVFIGDRYYVKATAIFKGSDSYVETATAYAREADEKKGMYVAQITGAASSYARKYALNGLFAIDDTKDADSKSTVAKADEVAKADATDAWMNKEQVKQVEESKEKAFGKCPDCGAPNKIYKTSGKLGCSALCWKK